MKVEADSSVIDWDGPCDPARPINWPRSKKWRNIFSISFLTFLTPLASSILAPATGLVLKDFQSTNRTLGSFSVSIYLIGFGLGPLVLAPLSEMYGRLHVYQITTAVFVVWNVACALAPNLGALLVFRLLAGLSGSAPMTLGAGSIGDLFVPQERGLVMAIWGVGPLMGPVLGPIACGYLSEAAGWRWVLWLVVIVSGIALVFTVLLQSETYEPVLLQRQVNRLKHETGNADLYSDKTPRVNAKNSIVQSIVRPLKMLFLSPIVALFSMYIGIVFGYLYLLFTTITHIYETTYHFSQGNTGLVYIGVGVGAAIGMVIFGALSDRIQIQLTAKNNGQSEPEFRLPLLIPGSILVPIGLFWYGWSVDKHVPWIMPVIGLAWIGFGMIGTFLPIQSYMVDAFGPYAASAVAANTLVRSFVGAFLPLAGPSMYATLGLGWGNSLLGFIALLMLPVPVIFYYYGKRIRTKFEITF
ncbi:MFS transporter [Aspergillus homomorphus CBS 101889]|uniref:Putative MFS multidrug transporter n=1 Tax=Aspergillus homomorphus (strain CBS 101889) TaxID=1450537 RepID=A0A395HGQ1_ASPHC|nr:putative MFS multidrug transporter [Aspergillus homomorphus CBS 101889]RAL07017.1 putative MFS multidrug transporter [Aspergillus homomorphus CBS 101889]